MLDLGSGFGSGLGVGSGFGLGLGLSLAWVWTQCRFTKGSTGVNGVPGSQWGNLTLRGMFTPYLSQQTPCIFILT